MLACQMTTNGADWIRRKALYKTLAMLRLHADDTISTKSK